MTQREDTAGEAWLRTLDPKKRPEAQVWMAMPPEEFQGRMAMAVADIKEELAEMRKPMWRTAAQWAGVAAASALAALAGSTQVPR